MSSKRINECAVCNQLYCEDCSSAEGTSDYQTYCGPYCERQGEQNNLINQREDEKEDMRLCK